MENKLTKKGKILIIFIILISIISITYKVYADSTILAWGRYADKADSTHAEEDWKHYLHGAIFNQIFKSPPNYFRKNMRGVIWNQGGKTKNGGHQDNGEEHVIDGAGSDGNTGYGGSWIGSANFPLKEDVYSEGESFAPKTEPDHMGAMDNVIWLKDLCATTGLLCSQPGGALTGSVNYINPKYAENRVSYEHDLLKTSIRTVKTYNVEETEEKVAEVANEDLNAEGVYEKLWRTPCQYGSGKSNTCTGGGNGPALAFILSELKNIENSARAERTPLQIAWWHFYNGLGESNSLTVAAQDFQNYINEVKESDSSDSSRTTSTGLTRIGFDLNYDPKFIDTDVTRKFDSKQNKYIIGPFKLDYVQYENFAYIYKLEVFINGLEDPVDKSKFKVAVADKGNTQSLKTLDEKEFPDSDTEFYIILDYDEDFRYLSDLKVDFQYQNANGSYTIYEGKYSTVNMQGEIYGEYNPQLYEKIQETKEWINEQFENKYAIWDIDSQYYISNADELLKKYTTIEGALDDKGYDLNFELTAFKYFIPNATDWAAGWPKVTTNIGTSICIWNYSFAEMVCEYKNAYDSYNSAEKRLGEAQSAYDDAEDDYDYWDNLLSGLDEDDPNYNTYVSKRNAAASNMTSAGNDIEEAETAKKNALKAMGGKEEYGERADYLWENEKPDYVPEISPGISSGLSGPTKKVPRPLEFVIWKDYTYTVVDPGLPAQTQAVAGEAGRWWELKELHWNGKENKIESAKIKIEKEIKGDVEIKDGTKFNFKVTVKKDGEVVGNEDLSLTWKNGADNFVTSEEYSWEVEVDQKTGKIKEETRPEMTYEVTEVDIPKGYSLVGINNATGNLKDGETAQVTVINTSNPTPYKGNLEILKKITETELGVDEYSIKNETFEFNVTISGNFCYKGTWYTPENPYVEIIKIKTDDKGEGSWKSDEILWTVDQNPTYVVEEIIPEDAVYELVNSSGTEGTIINGTTSQAQAIFENKQKIPDDKGVSIKVIKKLTISDKISEETLKEMTYKFKVNVYSDAACTKKLKDASGKEYAEQELIATMERGESEWIWTASTDEYKFLEPYIPEGSTDTGYPYFTIEEDETWCPMHREGLCKDDCQYRTETKFSKDLTQTANAGTVDNLSVDDKSIKGRFTKEGVATGVFENTIINNDGGKAPFTGNLVISKKIVSDQLKDNTFDFIVKVSGTFAFDDDAPGASGHGTFEDDEWYKNAVIQLSGNNENGNTIIKELTILKDENRNINIMEDENSYNSEKLVSIKIDVDASLNTSYSLTSNKFAWYGEAPTYSVEEKLDNAVVTAKETTPVTEGTITTPAGAVLEVKATGVPQKGSLDETTYNDADRKYNSVEVTAVNDAGGNGPGPKSGYVKIIKKLNLQDLEAGVAPGMSVADVCDIEYIKSLRFKFKITILGSGDSDYDKRYTHIDENGEMITRVVILGSDEFPVTYDEANNEYRWEYISPEYSWGGEGHEDEDALQYIVEEVESELQPNISFKTATGPDGSEVTGSKITGKLIEAKGYTEDNDEIIMYTKCEYINEVKVQHGKLQINKTSLNENLDLSKFGFKVNLIGKFYYKSSIDKVKFKLQSQENNNNGFVFVSDECNITDENKKASKVPSVFTNAEGKWTSEDIYWYGTKPRYTVEELSEEEYDKLLADGIIKKDADEDEYEEKYAIQFSSQNTSGEIQDSSKMEFTTASIINDTDDNTDYKGQIKVTKNISGSKDAVIDKDAKFTFRITVYKDKESGEKRDSNAIILNEPKTVKAGETFSSSIVNWKHGAPKPYYVVEELDSEGNPLKVGQTINVSASNTTYTFRGFDTSEGKYPSEGEIKENDSDQKKREENESNAPITISVTATNEIKEKTTQFIVEKQVILNKIYEDQKSTAFPIEVKLYGVYMIDGQKYNTEEGGSPWSQNISLSDGGKYDSPNITYWGDNTPTLIVKEKKPEYWETPKYSNNGDTGLVLQEDSKYNKVVITNSRGPKIELTMSLGGVVWEEEISKEKDYEKNTANGIKDDGEKGVAGVEVYIYENGTKLSSIPGDSYNSEIKLPIITGADGSWKAGGLKVLPNTGKYDVEFVYDGQTYEATNAFEIGGSAGDYISSTSNARMNKYKDSSLAIETDREDVNNRIQEIYGKNAITGSGFTLGEIDGSSGKKSISYQTEQRSKEENETRLSSELQTVDDSGIAFDLYKAKARTSAAGLQFPVDDCYQLEYLGAKLGIDGVIQEYRAIYEHCLHINLGLKPREDADVEVGKDLVSAKVVIDGEQIDYKFGGFADILSVANTNTVSRTTQKDEKQIKYELGLYNTDYYYRAEMYKKDGAVYDAVQEYYKSLDITPEDSELEVYLTYKIGLYNSSPTDMYLVQFNAINDYFDSSFGNPIQEKVERLVDNEKVTVAEKSYMYKENSDGTENKIADVTWEVTERNIHGSDGTTYNKMTTKDLNKVQLKSGEAAYIKVTFAIQKETFEEVKDCIAIGNKSNIIEVNNYSTFYADGSCAGKIDRDSAPDNVNIRNYNIKSWYEDDTDSAPVLSVTLQETNREINGLAWEDRAESLAGKEGVFDIQNRLILPDKAEEALIGGLTTQLIEKIKIPDSPGSTNYKEYDFLWPSSEPLDCLGEKTLEQLTGLKTTIETSRVKIEKTDNEAGIEVGQYRFTGIPSGTYVVRFLYGNNKMDLEDTKGISLKPAEALKANGNPFDSRGKDDEAKQKILTANYDEDALGATPVVYNGQDYKSTIYQAGFTQTDENGYLTNEKHDLTNKNLAESAVSDARDNEARRLEVIAESETITNANGTTLGSATDLSADHSDLYKNYSMFADTAKIDLELNVSKYDNKTEEENKVEFETEFPGIKTAFKKLILKAGDSVEITKQSTDYEVYNIDFGLIERPETNIVLDKEIEGIKLTTNTGKVLFDARYDISYMEVEENQIKSQNDLNKVVINDLPNGKFLVANISLNKASSSGINALQAINKNEIKPENEDNRGTKNFRFINIDQELLQGTTLELTYLMTALNVGETDYTSEKMENITSISTTDERNKESGINEVLKNELDPSVFIKHDIKALADEAKEANRTYNSGEEPYVYGKYIGSFYYTGKIGEKDVIVNSKVRQIIDYVDNDAMFDATYNTESDHMWRNTTINELLGNGIDSNRVLDRIVIPEHNILDNKDKSYKTVQRNNLILSTDDQKVATEEQIATGTQVASNAGFERKLRPFDEDIYNVFISAINNKRNNGTNITEGELESSIKAIEGINEITDIWPEKSPLKEIADLINTLPNKTEHETLEDLEVYADIMELAGSYYSSQITLTVTKTVSSQDDANSMAYDNITEVVKYENSVGRKDITAIPGNANPKEGEFETALKERDTSATELVTFTPPTGIEVQKSMTTQVLMIVVLSLGIVAVGIVVIKKKVLK